MSRPAITSSDGRYVSPAWANQVEIVGDLLGTTDGPGVRVEVYKAGETTAQRDSLTVDRDTRKPLLAKGDPVVALLYVLTNTGTETVDLAIIGLSTDETYVDSPYFGTAMWDSNDSWLLSLGLYDGTVRRGGMTDNDVYPLAPGGVGQHRQDHRAGVRAPGARDQHHPRGRARLAPRRQDHAPAAHRGPGRLTSGPRAAEVGRAVAWGREDDARPHLRPAAPSAPAR